MTLSILVMALAISFLGTLVASGLALLPFKEAHRLSNGFLFLCTLIGAGVGGLVATNGEITLAFPFDLRETVSPLFFNMNFVLDRFAGIFYALVNGVAMLSALYALGYLPQVSTYHLRNVNCLTAGLVFGLQGIVLASNIVGFLFFWQMALLVIFFLLLAKSGEASRRSAVLYLLITQLAVGGLAAGLFILSGGALLSTFSLIAYSVSALTATVLTVSLLLLTFSFSALAGLVPFHVWVPGAQEAAPSHISALLSGAMLKVALYSFLRVALFMMPSVPHWLPIVLLVLGLLSAIFGALYAVVERDIQRILASSSIANMGIIVMFVAIALLAANNGNEELMQATLFAALFQSLAHAVTKTGLVITFDSVMAQLATVKVEQGGGLARRMPQLSIIVCLLILAAAVLPPFAPFVAQWTFMQAVVGGLAAAVLPFVVALLLSLAGVAFVAGLLLFAMVRLYATVFLGEPRSEQARLAREPSLGLLLPGFLSAAGVTVMGLLSPKIMASLGALSLVETNTATGFIRVDGGSLLPLGLAIVMGAILALIVLIRYVVSNPDFERQAVVWSGGQSVTSRMEFTATSFSGPLRYFFRFLLRTQKLVVSTPVLLSNPWIRATRFQLIISSVWYEYMYAPLGRGVMWLAGVVRKIQNGSIQVYVGLIAMALVVAFIVAL